jgi:hypothetical protein
MNKQDIIDHIKDIVVTECEKEPEERQLFSAFGALIDKIEASIKETPQILVQHGVVIDVYGLDEYEIIDLDTDEDYAQWRRDSGDPTYGDEGA